MPATLERIQIKEVIVDFDIGVFLTDEEGDLPEICVQQGIDASAKKTSAKPKDKKTAKSQVESVKAKAKANKAANKSSGFKAFSQNKKQEMSRSQKAARTRVMNKALAKRDRKQMLPKGDPATHRFSSNANAHRQHQGKQRSAKLEKTLKNVATHKQIAGTGTSKKKGLARALKASGKGMARASGKNLKAKIIKGSLPKAAPKKRGRGRPPGSKDKQPRQPKNKKQPKQKQPKK